MKLLQIRFCSCKIGGRRGREANVSLRELLVKRKRAGRRTCICGWPLARSGSRAIYPSKRLMTFNFTARLEADNHLQCNDELFIHLYLISSLPLVHSDTSHTALHEASQQWRRAGNPQAERAAEKKASSLEPQRSSPTISCISLHASTART